MGTKPRDIGPLVEEVATALRMLAAERKLGVRALAAASGIPHPTVSKSLNGLRMIDVEELGKMSAAMGTTPQAVIRDAVSRLAERGISLADLIPPTRSNVTEVDFSVTHPSEDDLDIVPTPDAEVDHAASTGPKKADVPAADDNN